MGVPSVVECSAESYESFEDAVQQGIASAERKLGRITGAWIERQTLIGDLGKPPMFHVDMKVSVVDFFE